jgi:hypothetical protein
MGSAPMVRTIRKTPEKDARRGAMMRWDGKRLRNAEGALNQPRWIGISAVLRHSVRPFDRLRTGRLTTRLGSSKSAGSNRLSGDGGATFARQRDFCRATYRMSRQALRKVARAAFPVRGVTIARRRHYCARKMFNKRNRRGTPRWLVRASL